jgi:hypothetical protein
MNRGRGDNDPQLREMAKGADGKVNLETLELVKQWYTPLKLLEYRYDYAPTFLFLAYMYRRNSGWNDLNLAYELFAGYGDLQLKSSIHESNLKSNMYAIRLKQCASGGEYLEG